MGKNQIAVIGLTVLLMAISEAANLCEKKKTALEVMEDNLREFNLMHNRVAYTIALLMLCAVNSIVHFLMA